MGSSASKDEWLLSQQRAFPHPGQCLCPMQFWPRTRNCLSFGHGQKRIFENNLRGTSNKLRESTSATQFIWRSTQTVFENPLLPVAKIQAIPCPWAKPVKTVQGRGIAWDEEKPSVQHQLCDLDDTRRTWARLIVYILMNIRGIRMLTSLDWKWWMELLIEGKFAAQ